MSKFIDMFIEITIAVALFTPLAAQTLAVINDPNTSAGVAALWGLVTVLYAIAAIKVLTDRMRTRG